MSSWKLLSMNESGLTYSVALSVPDPISSPGCLRCVLSHHPRRIFTFIYSFTVKKKFLPDSSLRKIKFLCFETADWGAISSVLRTPDHFLNQCFSTWAIWPTGEFRHVQNKSDGSFITEKEHMNVFRVFLRLLTL